jgi:WXXGXW repeat (2 copies)
MRTVAVRSLFLGLLFLALSAATFGQVAIGVSITFAPPALPVYEQPICPGDDYIWTPGYWAWGDDDYYWVPGTWVEAPEVGFLWTPGYWGWGDGVYIFHEGFWGPTIGFYGGINYGFGYFGHGYEGGRWDNGHFFYNRSVNNVNATIIHNTYNTTIVNNNPGASRVSYSGGNGGVEARPSPEEEAAARGRHIGPVPAQAQHLQAARANPQLRASANQGKPPIAATGRPADFKTGVPASEAGAPYRPPARTENNAARTGAAGSNSAAHASDIQPHKSTPSNTGNATLDQKYQQQQDKLSAKQNQEHQKLQQQQEREHQQASQKNYNDAAKQQMEQRHQQQTQQLEQKHTTQTQQLQTRQPPPRQQQSRPAEKPH